MTSTVIKTRAHGFLRHISLGVLGEGSTQGSGSSSQSTGQRTGKNNSNPSARHDNRVHNNRGKVMKKETGAEKMRRRELRRLMMMEKGEEECGRHMMMKMNQSKSSQPS